jgi:hypothetical protein
MGPFTRVFATRGAFLCAALFVAAAFAMAAEGDLSPQQMEKLLKRIPEADANKDGKLTREEVQAYMRNRKSGKRGKAKKPNAQQSDAGTKVPDLATRVSAEALPGRNVLKWNDVLSTAGSTTAPSNERDTIAWAYSDDRGFYRVFRSCHLEDGYRILNLEGEVQESRYVDERVVPGVRYYYKVAAYRNKAELGVSTPVEVVAKEGRRDPVEEGLWKTSAGRFSLDEDLPPVVDEITTHGGIGGYAYGVTNRQLFLLYPSLPNKTSWPKSFRLEGSKQNEHLQDCLVLGSVGLDGSGGGKPSYRVKHSGWDSLVYQTVSSGGQSLGIWMNGMMPALTVYTDEPALVLFGNREEVGTPLPAWVAFSQNGRVVARPLAGRVSLEGMDRSWLLFWWGDGALTGQENVDTPCLAVLSARADAIAAGGGGLKLTFPHGARHVSLMPLYGVTKKSTKGWERVVPPEAVDSAARWERRLRSIPVRCRDRFELREAENCVRVTLSYEYLEAPDDWGTEPVALAPVAPSTSYAKLSGYPIQYQSAVIPQDFACYCGPFEAAEKAREVVYDLPAQMDAIVKGYTPQIVHPELLSEIKRTLNADAQVASAKDRGPARSKRRPRTIPLALAPYLAAYPILTEQSRKSVEQISGDYLSANHYFDLTTYRFRRDRYSGKKYIVSNDPEQRSATGVTD